MTGPLRALRELGVSFATSPVLVLCHHAVRRRDRFHAQMSSLLERGYAVLTMKEFTAWLRRGQPIRSPAVVLTFETAPEESNVTVALPKPSCNPSHTRTCSNVKLTVGHDNTVTMPSLVLSGVTERPSGGFSAKRIAFDGGSAHATEGESKWTTGLLEDVIGQEVTAFCYPDGLRNPRVAAAVQGAGFEVAFTIDLGGVRAGDDSYQLRRVAILGEPDRRSFACFMKGTRGVAGAILIGWKIRERFLE